MNDPRGAPALSTQQQLAYARDLRRIYDLERARREQLEAANRALAAANAELQRRIESLLTAQESLLAINASRALPQLLEQLTQALRRLLHAHAAVVFPWDPGAGRLGEALGAVSDAERGILAPLAQGPLGAAATTAPDLHAVADVTAPSEPAHAPALALGWRALVGAPLRVRDALVGVLFVAWAQPHAVDDHERMVLLLMAQHAAASLASARSRAEVVARAEALRRTEQQLVRYAQDLRRAYEAERQRRAEVQAAYRATVEALAAAIETRDPYTGGHVGRVARFSLAIGRELQWPQDALDTLELGALLHDVGKIGVEDRVLRKPGPLDPEEEAQMRLHAELGARILRDVPFLRVPTACALRHHERYDGLGYPGGLAGADIPYEARIIAVADTYDAMTTDRPYRWALPVSVALAEIARGAGTQFDPEVVAAFLSAVRKGALVLTDPPQRGASRASGPPTT